jgi:hypothetical protein
LGLDFRFAKLIANYFRCADQFQSNKGVNRLIMSNFKGALRAEICFAPVEAYRSAPLKSPTINHPQQHAHRQTNPYQQSAIHISA